VGEKSLIERIRRRVRGGAAVIRGIGDDSAVLRVPAGHQLLVTTDFTLEGVHFLRKWHPPEVVGWRCLMRGLSDIAAMGGAPRAAFLSIALDRGTSQKWVDRFLTGLLDATEEFRVPLAGGDTAQSAGGIQADIVLVGSVPSGRAVLRSGARPGDGIYVTGELGGSAAALARIRRKGMGNRLPATFSSCGTGWSRTIAEAESSGVGDDRPKRWALHGSPTHLRRKRRGSGD
jgi:thiamine-monophosphate kinase